MQLIGPSRVSVLITYVMITRKLDCDCGTDKRRHYTGNVGGTSH